MVNTMKKNGIEVQVDACKKDSNIEVHKKDKNGEGKIVEKESFYIRVYDDAVSKKNIMDNIIIE